MPALRCKERGGLATFKGTAPSGTWPDAAGLPTTVTPSGMAETTTDPAPTTTRAPMVVPGRTDAPIPKRVFSPSRHVPPMTERGAACTPELSSQSCSMMADVLTMQSSPILARALMTAPAMTTVPPPIDALGETIADGWMIGGMEQERDRSFRPSLRLSMFEPIATVAASIPPVARTASI